MAGLEFPLRPGTVRSSHLTSRRAPALTGSTGVALGLFAACLAGTGLGTGPVAAADTAPIDLYFEAMRRGDAAEDGSEELDRGFEPLDFGARDGLRERTLLDAFAEDMAAIREAGLWLGNPRLASQGSGVTWLRTGVGEPWTSVSMGLGAVPAGGRLELEFGFTTAETWVPGAFLDSFTLRVVNEAGQSLYLVTSDATGNVWAPLVPGSEPLDPGAVSRVPVAFVDPFEVLGSTWAFEAGVDLPVGWQGQTVTLWLDLFNNLDPAGSAAYLRRAVLVPEPGTVVVWVLGMVILAVIGRRN